MTSVMALAFLCAGLVLGVFMCVAALTMLSMFVGSLAKGGLPVPKKPGQTVGHAPPSYLGSAPVDRNGGVRP